MHLALYDITLDGHHGAYLTVIAREALMRGWRLSVIVPKAAALHPAFRVLEQVVGPENVRATEHWVPPLENANPVASVTRHFAQYRAARRSIQESGERWDFVYAPNLDYMMRAVQVLGAPSYPVPMGGMCMGAAFHLRSFGIASGESGVRPVIQKMVFERVLRAKGIACVTTADPMLAEFASGQKKHEFSKVKYVPEIGMDVPCIDKQAARARFGIAEEDRVMLVYGMLTRRKAVEELLRAIATLNPGERWKVLVVGEADGETRAFLEAARAAGAPLATYLQFADDVTEQAAFRVADAVWVAYREHGVMSGVFYQAVCCGVPVITADYGVLPRIASEYGVGISVNLDDAAGTGERIARLLGDERQYAVYQRNAEALREAHLPVNFGRAVCDVIMGCVFSTTA